MDEYQEFVGKLQKRGSNPYKISFCYGSRDAWKWVRKNKWKSLEGIPCEQSLYSQIVNAVNKQILELLLEGHEVELPHKMGSLLLCSLPTRVAWEDGELKTNYRTDWLKTLKLWFEDEEARNTHKSVKRISKDIYFIRYYKTKANYTNKQLYKFRVNRNLAKRLGKTLEIGRVNAEQRIFI